MANKQMHHLVIDGDNYEIVDLVARQSGGSVTVDSELSNTSTNPVQNKVIKLALDGKVNTIDVLSQITTSSDMPINSNAVADYFRSYEVLMLQLIRSGNLVSINKGFLEIYATFIEGAGRVYFVMPNSQTDVIVLTVDRVDASQGKIYLSSVTDSTLYEVVLTSTSNNSMAGTVVTTNLGTATTTTAGLMSATDKTNLDTLMSDYQSASTALG